MFTVAQNDVLAEGQEICIFKSTSEFLITMLISSLLIEEVFQPAVFLEKCKSSEGHAGPAQSQISSCPPAWPKELRVPITGAPLPCFETCPQPLTNTPRTLDKGQALRQSMRFFPSSLCVGKPLPTEAFSGIRARGGQGSSSWDWKEQQDMAQARGCPNLRS